MPVTNHTIAVTVNGVDKTSSLIKDSLFIRLQLNNKSNTAELKFKDYEPTERATIQISINGSVVFGGFIIRKSATILGVKGSTVVNWSVECKDWSELLESVTVNEELTESSDSSIVAYLFTTYLPSSGFNTSTDVRTLDNDLDITFTNVSLREALDQLAQRVGANWYIKPNKNIYWFSPSNPDTASFGISSSPNDSTTFGFLNNSLSYDIDSSTIVNQIKIIAGVKSTGTKQTDSFTGDGSKKTFTLSQIPDAIVYCGYNDGIGTYTTYGSFVGLAPQDKLATEGGSYRAVIDQANKTIKLEGSTGNPPANGTSINVVYYYKELVDLTYDDLGSQALFGTYPISLMNQTFGSEEEARKKATALLEQNSRGKSKIGFDTTKYGLLPGQLVTIDVSELDLTSGLATSKLLLESGDKLLLESGDKIVLEEHSIGQTFLIQSISLTPVVTDSNTFMLVCKVEAGQYVPDIVDSLAKISTLKSNTGTQTNSPIQTRLSNISSDMGEVTLGRATFTDGGTARFGWGNPGGASGVVVGLEDTNGSYGAVYIYDSGTVKAKLGRLDDQPAIGTVTPSGWGLVTTNGFFSGLVYASQLEGGTVTGSLIQGNTINGGTINGSYISGGTVTGISLIGNTIATGTPPINSSNPGVYMDSTGLYGYGSVGLTFRLSSDPAIKPYFSSGTITEVIYEVTTNSVIRTGITNPRVQMDNSGIFGYDSGGNLRFSFDTGTGYLQATNGSFSGTVSASLISGGTVSGNRVTGGTITGVAVTANNITGGTVSGALVTGNTVSGGTVTGAIVTAGTVTGNTISGGTVSGSYITGGTVTGALVTAVGGSVTLDNSNGITLQTQSSPGFSDPRSLKFKTGATTVASISSTPAGGTYIVAGVLSSSAGFIHNVAHSATTDYSTYDQYPDYFNWKINTIDYLSLILNYVMAYKHIVPQDTSLNLQLGDSTHAFRYLYLKDDAGVTRRVSINSSGVLTVT